MNYGQMYAVSFSSANSSAVAKDIFEITASTLSSLVIHSVEIAQVAAALTSSAIESLTVAVFRGATDADGGGSTGTPVNLNGRSSATATFLTQINSSSPGSSAGGAAKLVFARPWNTQTPFVWRPPVNERPTCKLSQRLQVRLGAPAAAMVIGGTIIVEEIGRIPGSLVK